MALRRYSQSADGSGIGNLSALQVASKDEATPSFGSHYESLLQFEASHLD